VGYGIVPKELVGPLCDRKGNEDFGSPNFNQNLLALIMERGVYGSHVVEVQAAYRKKRDCMLQAASRYFGDIPGVYWVHPHGGLYVWMTVPDHIDTGFEGPLFAQAAGVEKVMYVPGSLCYADPHAAGTRNRMRLSFGVQNPAGIDEGMQRLARAVRLICGN
jgi:2-aminoadipate transaminase